MYVVFLDLILTHTIHYSGSITFVCTGKTEIPVTHFISTFTFLLRSGAKPTLSIRYLVIIQPKSQDKCKDYMSRYALIP